MWIFGALILALSGLASTMTIFDGAGGQCGMDQQLNYAFLGAASPAYVMANYTDITEPAECYSKCCLAKEQGCNAASLYNDAGSLKCVILHCLPLNNCTWQSSVSAASAMMSESENPLETNPLPISQPDYTSPFEETNYGGLQDPLNTNSGLEEPVVLDTDTAETEYSSLQGTDNAYPGYEEPAVPGTTTSGSLDNTTIIASANNTENATEPNPLNSNTTTWNPMEDYEAYDDEYLTDDDEGSWFDNLWNKWTGGGNKDEPEEEGGEDQVYYNDYGKMDEYPQYPTGENNEYPQYPTGENNEHPQYPTGENNEYPQYPTGETNEYPQYPTEDANKYPQNPEYPEYQAAQPDYPQFPPEGSNTVAQSTTTSKSTSQAPLLGEGTTSTTVASGEGSSTSAPVAQPDYLNNVDTDTYIQPANVTDAVNQSESALDTVQAVQENQTLYDGQDVGYEPEPKPGTFDDGYNKPDLSNLRNGLRGSFVSGRMTALVVIVAVLVVVVGVVFVGLRCQRRQDKRRYRRLEEDSDLTTPIFRDDLSHS